MATIRIFVLLACVSCALAAFAQNQPAIPENPLTLLKDEVKRELERASVPFSDEQERAILLMMEDRRKASEDLFGGLMDFKAGPTQGQDADRLRSAIEWMRNEFLVRLQDYLSPQQLAVWSRSRENESPSRSPNAGGARGSQQTQYVRINNNAFTAEDDSYRFRNAGGTSGASVATSSTAEVIQRGGAGTFHGNAQLLLKDESLNAGKRFADNKPPYQERRTSFDVSGPTIPQRLTSSVSFNQTEAKNVDTIRATLPDSIFSLGITRPTTSRTWTSSHTLQVADAHALTFNFSYATNSNKNQGVGGFILPERAFDSTGKTWNLETRQFSSLSSRTIFETRFNIAGTQSETIPKSTGSKINVIDAFSSGGAQNTASTTGRTYDTSVLFTRLGEKFTLKTGGGAIRRRSEIISEPNFIGTFTFSTIAAYRNGLPLNYRVTRGIPLTETAQWETALFAQQDYKVTSRLTVMYGMRYELQTNLHDRNNFAPRVGLAYGIGRAAVIRAGAGIFQHRLLMSFVEVQNRLDGKRQYEIVIDNPSYPDPFQVGTIRNTFPSVRVNDPELAMPYSAVAMASVERTFLNTLFVSAAYDFNREIHRVRWRNLNAPRDTRSSTPQSCTPGQPTATCQRPDPSRGNIVNMESTGLETAKTLRLSLRERFSIFNVTASYTWARTFADALPEAVALGGNGSGIGGGGGDNFGFGTEGLPSDNYNVKSDWAQVALPEHTINSGVNARLPLGLFLTSTMTSTLGRRYTITTGKDDNMDGSVNDRPRGLARNTEGAPSSLLFSFNISKAFYLGSSATPAQQGVRTNVNLFANLTNAFNRPNYAAPSGVITSPNFGRSSSAGTPRELEIGLRYQF